MWQEGKVYLFKHRPDPLVQHPLSVVFANGSKLIGCSVEEAVAAGQPLPLTLFWRAPQVPAADLTVFNHLVDARGKVVTQRDSQPDSGAN